MVLVLRFISMNDSEARTPWILPIPSEISLCISASVWAYIVTMMSNLPVTSEISRTPFILNNSSIMVSLYFESMLSPVSAFTPYPNSLSFTTIVNRSISFLFVRRFILLYTTDGFTLIFSESFGMEIDASSLSSESMVRSSSSIFTV